jgi:post-segregation antitoxin (ccd killing protein)
MKAKLTVTVDEDLIPKAKERARSQGVSLSQLIEQALAELVAEEGTPFSRRWRGQLRPAGRKDQRYKALSRKYL